MSQNHTVKYKYRTKNITLRNDFILFYVSGVRLTDIRFYVQLDTKWVIPEMLAWQ